MWVRTLLVAIALMCMARGAEAQRRCEFEVRSEDAIEVPVSAGLVTTIILPEALAEDAVGSSTTQAYELEPYEDRGLAIRPRTPAAPAASITIATVSRSLRLSVALRAPAPGEQPCAMVRVTLYQPPKSIPSAVPSLRDRAVVRLQLGLGARDFANHQGMDHRGLLVDLDATVRLWQYGRHTIAVGIGGGWTRLEKGLGEGTESRARVLSLVTRVDYGLVLIPRWALLHLDALVGVSHYYAHGSDDGLEGVEFSLNPLLFSINDPAVRIGAGIRTCTLRDWLCASLRYVADVGVNPTLDVINGPGPALGLSPRGLDLLVGVNVLGWPR